jgi:hypothetical protein
MIQNLRRNILWMVQLACVLAVVFVVGGLAIAYRLESATPAVPIHSMTSTSMRCSDATEIFRHLSVDDPARYSSLLTQVCDN